MAFSPDEIEQIRFVVASELQRRPAKRGGLRRALLWIAGIVLVCIFSVVLLHVMVISGFTLYHLTHG